jgi:hypothetical protein
MNDCMIDMETLSTEPNAVVLTLGAVKFDRKSGMDKNIFYHRIDIQSCVEIGCVVDKATQKWWKSQDPDVRKEAMGAGDDRLNIKEVLIKFSEWFRGSKYIWSHGATFDVVIMECLFKKCGLPVPWKFWNVRDTRTLYDVAGIQNSDLPQNSKHHALEDCKRQIVGVQMALSE